MKTVKTLALFAAALSSMAFTLPGCPDVEGLNQRIAELDKKSADNSKQLREIADQMRLVNDEHNTMKQLVSQVSTTVLEQKDALEKLDTAMKSRSSSPAPRAAAPKASKPAARRNR